MLKLLTLIFILTFTGCSDNKETKSVASPPSRKSTFPVYKKSEVLLALKYNLSESAIKEISLITKYNNAVVLDGEERNHQRSSEDSDYVSQIRRLVSEIGAKYKISQATIVNILIDRQILDMRDTLPNDVAEEVSDRISSSNE